MNPRSYHIVTIDGDGIGPEVCRAAMTVLGEACGSGAHLTNLVRTTSGAFGVEKSLSMDNIESIFKIF